MERLTLNGIVEQISLFVEGLQFMRKAELI